MRNVVWINSLIAALAVVAVAPAQERRTGTLKTETITGKISGDQITFDIYLPEGYRSEGEGYPVVYNLHGRGGAYNRGNPGQFRRAMEKAIVDGILPPVIAVYPDGTQNGWYADSKDRSILIETHIIREILPWVDEKYNTKASRDFRVIQGMSMGGYGASLLGIKFPELFSISINYDGAMFNWDTMTRRSGKWEPVAPVMFDNDQDYYDQTSSPWALAEKNRAKIADQLKIRIIEGALGHGGTAKSSKLPGLLAWRDHLESLGIEVDYVDTDCGHNLPCLLETAGEGSFRLMAQQFAIAAKTHNAGADKPRSGRRAGDRSAAGQRPARYRPKAPPENVEVRKNVVYGKGGERELKLDLFLPKGAPAPRPAIVFIYGGRGNKSRFHSYAAEFAGKGYVGACIEFRHFDQARFPGPVEDSKCAVRWLRAHAKQYGIDPDRIAACGSSGGGHRAAMLGVTDKSDGWEGDGGWSEYSSKVNLVIAFCGAFDFSTAAFQPGTFAGDRISTYLGGTAQQLPELYAQASPITHVDSADPPFLLLHGTADRSIPFSQSVAMQKKLQSAGVTVDLFTAEGADHGFLRTEQWYPRCVTHMDEFLDQHFRRKDLK